MQKLEDRRGGSEKVRRSEGLKVGMFSARLPLFLKLDIREKNLVEIVNSIT
jgi:hypothetical protein